MRTSRFAMFFAALALALAAAPALAHGPGGGGACRADIKALCAAAGVTPGSGNCLKALCPDVTPGSGGFVSCLQHYASQSQLSEPCQQQLNDIQAKMEAWKAACADSGDVANVCPGVTGPREIGKCLHQAVRDNQLGTNGNPVSPNCAALLAQHHRHHHHHRQEAPNPAPAQSVSGN